ncbi:MAG: hypothetical protein K2J60_03645 [Acetatifactor sp.]|nr:hypothetical protein [Acetatifactor sp.]
MDRDTSTHKQIDCKMKHIYGLPIADGTVCKIRYSNDAMEINANRLNFNLPMDETLDISIKTDKEINTQEQYVSSIGGALLFGPVGAMIGGRAKKKKKTTFGVTNYLVITYKKMMNSLTFNLKK